MFFTFINNDCNDESYVLFGDTDCDYTRVTDVSCIGNRVSLEIAKNGYGRRDALYRNRVRFWEWITFWEQLLFWKWLLF